MDQVYVLISNLLETMLQDTYYVFKKSIETDNSYQFVLVLEKQAYDKYVNKKINVVTTIVDAFNVKESISAKKVKILVEVFDEFG
ncbi:hypothetical protein [Spiroplasma culicicola]|uniref:Uncharacterized protein n=1 Tax=Spiroplasma culicicola AES-1 TaxID=1276246 RepID=W6A787_9MOLU|nr:hypothetical protein [Spiroplasma culicicola]AHI52695.1 hypothetical protein SCULI_v1c03540 [Spiroplasma culicicola AES-1]